MRDIEMFIIISATIGLFFLLLIVIANFKVKKDVDYIKKVVAKRELERLDAQKGPG